MREVLEAALRAEEQGDPAALVTVIATEGSTPQKAGAKMVVYPDGRTAGTIGGGGGGEQRGPFAGGGCGCAASPGKAPPPSACLARVTWLSRWPTWPRPPVSGSRWRTTGSSSRTASASRRP